MVKYVLENALQEKIEDDKKAKSLSFFLAERKAVRNIMGAHLMKMAKENEKIVFVTADMASMEDYIAAGIPEYRAINLGLCEANTVLAAAGLAKEGFIPIYVNMSWLLGRSYNNIFQSVGTDNFNVKFIMYARGWAGGGGSHHEINDIAFMRCIPQILIMAPADPVEMVKCITAGVNYIGAVFIRIGGQNVPNLFEEDYPFKIGKAATVREGEDATIISFGTELWKGLDAAHNLSKEGIETRVIDMCTLKPMDEEAIVKAAEETGAIVTAEDHSIIGGLGEAVARVVCRNHPVPMNLIGVRDRYSQSTRDFGGGWKALEEAYNLTAKDIADAVKETIKRK
jgi:transketolase